MKKPWVLSYPLSTQRRLWSDWADAQADLSLHWAHTYFVGFVMSRLNYCLLGLIDGKDIEHDCINNWHYDCINNWHLIIIINSYHDCRKSPKNSYTRKISCSHPKIWTRWLCCRVICSKDADGFANSVDPDQTATLGALWSWSALFAQTYLSENFGSLFTAYSHSSYTTENRVFHFHFVMRTEHIRRHEFSIPAKATNSKQNDQHKSQMLTKISWHQIS